MIYLVSRSAATPSHRVENYTLWTSGKYTPPYPASCQQLAFVSRGTPASLAHDGSTGEPPHPRRSRQP